MISEIPKFHETFNPILEILKDGMKIHSREIQRLVIEKHYSNLPEDLLKEKTKSGEILIHNRIAWGKSYLKKGRYIFYPERGFVQISDKGLQQRTNLDLKTVAENEDFLNFYIDEKPKSQENISIKKTDNATPEDLIDQGFNQIEIDIKNELLEKLKTIDPYYLEKLY